MTLKYDEKVKILMLGESGIYLFFNDISINLKKINIFD